MIKYDLTRKANGLEKHPTVIVEEYESVYVLYVEREAEGSEMSKITFEENNAFCDLEAYLRYVLGFKDRELQLLYNT